MDDRLLDCTTMANVEANFTRILALIDALEERLTAVEIAKES